MHGEGIEWGEARENWPLEWSWKDGKVNSVEMFVFSSGAMEVDISFWVFFIEGNVQLDGSLDVLSISGRSVITMIVIKGSINLVTGNMVWHKKGGSKKSRVSPALAGFWVNSVVDGNISFTKAGLLEGGPDARFSGRGQVTGVSWVVLSLTALLVWPTVAGSLILLSLRSMSHAGNLNSSSVGWTGWSFLSDLVFLTPNDVDGTFVGRLVDSFVVKEVGDLGGSRVDVNADNAGPSSGFVTGSSLDLNVNLFHARLGNGDGGINVLGLGDGTDVLGVKGSLGLKTESKLFLGIGFVLDLDLTFELVIDGRSGGILLEVSLQSTSFSGWRKEQGLEKVTGSKTDLSEWSTEASTEVLVFRSEEFAEGAENVNAGVNLFAVVVLDSSLDSFHELVLVSRSELAFFTVLFALGDDGISLASWAGLVEKVDNFLVAEGGRGVILNGSNSGGVNLGDNWVFGGWCVDDKVKGLLLDVKTNAHLTWETSTDGTDGRNGVGTSESWKMVVDRGATVEVDPESCNNKF